MLKRTLLTLFCLVSLNAYGSTPLESDEVKSDEDRHIISLALNMLKGDWAIVALNGQPVLWLPDDRSERPHLIFSAPCYETGNGHCNPSSKGVWDPAIHQDGRLSVSGYSGCNWFGGEALLQGSRILIEVVTSTERGCGNLSSQEQALYALLTSEPDVKFETASLSLTDQNSNRVEAVPLEAE